MVPVAFTATIDVDMYGEGADEVFFTNDVNTITLTREQWLDMNKPNEIHVGVSEA